MSTEREQLTVEKLKQLLLYDPITGDFIWLKRASNSRVAGSVASKSTNSDGYISICIANRGYKAHRLAWLYTYGTWPDQIDHINGVRSDNRLANLRNVSVHENNHNQRKAHVNNKLGVQGVYVLRDGFQAQIRVNGKKKYLGKHESIELAHQAYLKAKAELHVGYVP